MSTVLWLFSSTALYLRQMPAAIKVFRSISLPIASSQLSKGAFAHGKSGKYHATNLLLY